MSTDDDLTRRMFLARFGKTSMAVAILGMGAVACSDDATEPTGAGVPATGSPTSGVPTTTTTSPVATTESVVTELAATDWARVDLGFVSAYLLVRSGEAAVIDTGNPGSAPSIESGLAGLGLDWSAVAHVILTHQHGDHIGSLEDVMVNAAAATAYAGAEDIPNIRSPRPLTSVGDGDQVFGLDIVATPGHTPGHISVVDPVGRLLVAGDALNGEGGGVVGPNPQFTPDMATANLSAKKLADLDVDTLLFGHGEPVLSGGRRLLAELAAKL